MTKDSQPNQAVLFEEESDQESLPSLAEDDVEEETRPPSNSSPSTILLSSNLWFLYYTGKDRESAD